jgi:hypothetical protein
MFNAIFNNISVMSWRFMICITQYTTLFFRSLATCIYTTTYHSVAEKMFDEQLIQRERVIVAKIYQIWNTICFFFCHLNWSFRKHRHIYLHSNADLLSAIHVTDIVNCFVSERVYIAYFPIYYD